MRTKRVAEVLRELTDQLRARGDGPLSTEVFSPAVERLCKNCKQSHRCWGANYNTMMDCLTEMAMLLRRGADLAECDLPQPFASVCVKRAEFVAEVVAETRRFEEMNRFRQDGLGDVGVLREQYRCFSAVLDDLGEAACEEDIVPDPRMTERLLPCLPPGSTLRAEYGRQGKLRLLGCCLGPRPDLRRLCQMAAAVSGRHLSPPDLTRTEGGWEFSIGEAASFTVSTRRHISPCPGERVAGDTVRDFRTEDRKYVTVLSDGMGAGGAASRKSRMATDCLEKLMQAGLGRESALRVLNSALLIGAEPRSTPPLTSQCSTCTRVNSSLSRPVPRPPLSCGGTRSRKLTAEPSRQASCRCLNLRSTDAGYRPATASSCCRMACFRPASSRTSLRPSSRIRMSRPRPSSRSQKRFGKTPRPTI